MTRLLTNIQFLFIIGWLAVSSNVQGQALSVSLGDSFTYNDTISTTINIENFSSLGAITLNVFFDNTVLTPISITKDTTFQGTFASNVIGNKILLAWTDIVGVTQADTFVTIQFLKQGDFCSSDIIFGGALEIADSTSNILNAQYNNATLYHLKAETPTLLYPASNTADIPVNAIFRWQDYDLSCVDGYGFQVATDTNFTQLLIDTIATDTFFTVTGLPELSTNYWRVAKIDELGNYYWSDVSSASTKSIDTTSVNIENVTTWNDTVQVTIDFINNEPLGLFDLGIDYDTTALQFLNFSNVLLPNINVNDTLGQVQLNWQTTGEPFILPSDTLITLTFIKKTACVTPIIWAVNSGFYFNNNTTQIANFENGSITFSDSATTNLLFPNDGSVEVFIRPELTWNDVYCSNGYQVQISKTPTFATVLIDTVLVDTMYIPTILQGDSLYYWRVGRYNILDSLYWSDTLSFTTESVLPITATAYDVITENNTFFIPIQIDSLANAIGFEVFLNYDMTAVDFIGFTDTTTLIANLTVQDNNGVIKISWNSFDSTLANTANISSDTLLQLEFVHLAGCETILSWQALPSDFYHINSTINIDASYTNSLVTFLQNEIPQQIPTAAVTTIHPDFYWQTMNCVENYHFQLALDNQFTQIVTDSMQLDTVIWQPNLQPNTTYFWRVAKEDFVGDLFWSDTLSFTTADLYTSKLTLDSILTYQNTAHLALTIDSIFFVNGFQLELNYNENELNFVGLSDTLFTNITTSTNNGVLTIFWSDTTFYNVVNDTLFLVNFENIGACQTPIMWNNQTLNFRENAILQNPIITKNGSIEFLNANAPTLATPFNNQNNVYPIVDFNFQSVVCTEEYQIQIATSNDFSMILLDSFVVDTFLNAILLDHNSTYFWRVGRWDSQNDLYWSDTLTFQTEILPTVQIEASQIITYEDTMRIAIRIDSVVWAESFNLVITFDDAEFEYAGFSDTLFGMDINELNGGAININWAADSSGLEHWLNINSDTIVYLHFKTINGCYTDLTWEFDVTNFIYKTPSIPILNDNFAGSIEWVNDDASILLFPPNDTSFLPVSFEMSWQSVNCTESYTIQIATDSVFDNIIIEENNLIEAIYIVTNLEKYTSYYWKIGQMDSQGVLHWSNHQSFKTDIENENSHWIFPNPANDVVNIWFEKELTTAATLKIFNSIGQLMGIQETTDKTKQLQLDVRHLDRGMYFMQFDDGNNQWTEKVLVD